MKGLVAGVVALVAGTAFGCTATPSIAPNFLTPAQVEALFQSEDLKSGQRTLEGLLIQGEAKRITDGVFLFDDTGGSLYFAGNHPQLRSGESQPMRVVADVRFLTCDQYIRCGLSIIQYRDAR